MRAGLTPNYAGETGAARPTPPIAETGRRVAKPGQWVSTASIAAAAALVLGGLICWALQGLPEAGQVRGQLWARHAPKGHWTWVPLWAISPKLQAAVVIWEDPFFYHHHGFNYSELAKAFVEDVRAGSYVRGGSTIPQQVAKNLFVGSEKTLLRKFREAVVTRRLENALSKEEILETYLNIAEWGEGVAGAEAASRFYFGKAAENLTWPEAALLAGILPNPRRFNPLTAPEEAFRLRQAVLTKLVENGDMTLEEYRAAASAPMTMAPRARTERVSSLGARANPPSASGRRVAPDKPPQVARP